MDDPPIGPATVICENCGSPAMIHKKDPQPDSDVVCADCGTRIGTYAEFVAMAEALALRAIRQGLGSSKARFD
jgi:DNA-directed RNA polymerase subunit RPC12/RpoP